MIRFSVVTVIILLIVLVVSTLINHKVVSKYVITVIVLGIILLVALGLVQLRFFFRSFGFLIWLLYNFIVTLKHLGNYFTRLSYSQVVMSFVFLFSSSIYGKDQTNPLVEPPPVFSIYGPYFFYTFLLAGNILQSMISHIDRNRAWLAAVDQVTWGLPSFVGFTRFNFSGFFHYVVKVFKKYSGP